MAIFEINPEQAVKNYNALKKALPDAVIAYALKANYDPRILKELASVGCAAEACSDYEHVIARKSGFQKVIRTGYGTKREAWLTNAEQLKEYNELKGLKGARLRLNPKSKLGIDEAGILTREWDCIAIHTRENFKNALLKAENIASQVGAEYVDAGGGFRETLDEERVKVLKSVKKKLIIEPGRYLVGNACQTIAKVLAVKEDKIIIDAGMNFLNKFSNSRYNVTTDKPGKKNNAYKIYGPIPTDIDNIGTHNLPVMTKGDKVIIQNTGAYTMSMASNWTQKIPKVKYSYYSDI